MFDSAASAGSSTPPTTASTTPPSTPPPPTGVVTIRDRVANTTTEAPDAPSLHPGVSGDGCVVAYSVPVVANGTVQLMALDRCAAVGGSLVGSAIVVDTVTAPAALPAPALSTDGSVIVWSTGRDDRPLRRNGDRLRRLPDRHSTGAVRHERCRHGIRGRHLRRRQRRGVRRRPGYHAVRTLAGQRRGVERSRWNRPARGEQHRSCRPVGPVVRRPAIRPPRHSRATDGSWCSSRPVRISPSHRPPRRPRVRSPRSWRWSIGREPDRSWLPAPVRRSPPTADRSSTTRRAMSTSDAGSPVPVRSRA